MVPLRCPRPPRWFAALLLLVCAMPVPMAVAASPASCPRALDQYRVQVWQQRDGLPQDAVMALAQTPDGFVWIGMEDGLARFDGATFEPIDLRPAVGTTSEYINALEVGPDARLYVGTGSSGLLAIDSDARPVRASPGHWPRQPVQTLLVHAGQRWAGLRGGGLVDFRGAGPRVIGPGQGLGGPGVTALAPRRQGGIWIGLGAGGVQWYDGRAFHRLPQLQPLGEIHVEDVLEDSAGHLWLATRSGLFRVSGNDVRRYGPQDGLRSDVIKSLLQDRNGHLWVGTGGEGVGRLCGDRFDLVGAEQGLPAAPVIDLLEDGEGAIWAAGGGLVRLSAGAALPVTVHQGLPAKPILPILQDRRGAMWIGTFGGGLVHWTPERTRTITQEDGLSSDFVLALAQGPGDTVWAGTRNGINLLRDGRVVPGRMLSTPTVMSLLHDGRRLWIGTVDGLASLAEGAAVVEPVPGGRFGAIVVMLFRDSRGVLWIGTDGAGLFRMRDGVVTPAPFTAQLSTNAVFAMLETKPGVLWMATGRGLARWDGRQLRTVSTLQGLPGDNLFSLLADASGRVWASSNRGVFAAPLEELEKAASGEGRVAARLFTEVDGMPLAETNGGFQPAAWRDAQGRHWYGTREGVAVFDPATLPERDAPPRVLLRGVQVDQRALVAGPRIAVGPDPGLVEIGYVAPSFSQPQKLEYQYRLKGFDDDWYSARAARTAVYHQLPPGRFRFEVRARYASGPWSDPASMDLEVEPAIAERWWFRAGLVLLLLFAAAALLHQWLRTRDARRRQLQQVQKLESIGQLTGGIAHDFNNVLAAIVQSSDALASALPRNHPLQAATMEILRAADLGGSLTRQLLAFARREETQPRWVDLASEVAEMESFVRRLLPDSIRIESRYDPVGACLIDPVHLQQIVLNLVLNARDAMPEGGRLAIAVAAAARGAVTPLLLAPERSYARLSVEDTGTGMSAAVRERIFEPFFSTKPRDSGTGLGLAVTYGIVRKAGGTIAVEAEPGSGAAFHVFLPVDGRHDPHPMPPVPEDRAEPRTTAISTTATAASPSPSPSAPSGTRQDAGDGDGEADRLLILDDDRAIAASVARAAANDGFAVRIADTPAHFFQLVGEWKPSHVIIDLVMPLMDGVEVLRTLADSGYPGRIVVMSGMGPKVLEAARRSGAAHGLEVAGVLDKPFRAEGLRNVLRGAVATGSAAPARVGMDQRLLLEQDLADALERNEFVQAYQPEIHLASGRIIGFESLVRWQHPARGLVYPDQFIPLAERCGRINALTFHVIRSSLEWLAGLPAHSTAGVSINLSARSLNDISVFDVLQEQCEHWQLQPERITLELTETSAMLDAVDALDTLTRLRLRGYGLAIDDFGTGYSSMLQLARLPFSQIKIDKSFVMSMGESTESRKIVESTISLGRALSLVTVAEGVEDAATMEALRALGCDRAQGYHIARPMDGEAARRWYLDSGTAANAAADT